MKEIHHVMCHTKPEILKTFFRDSSENDDETMRVIDEVYHACKICKFKFKKSPSKPKVALPVSNNFNQCVSIDLKGPWNKAAFFTALTLFVA